MSRLIPLLLTAACAPASDSAEPEEDTGHAGMNCGEGTKHDVEIVARVVSGGEANFREEPGIEVSLDDRGYTGLILGMGTTDANGEVSFMAVGVTALEGDCGALLDYWVVATDPNDASRTVEDDMNAELHTAIDGGSLRADIRDFPLDLD